MDRTKRLTAVSGFLLTVAVAIAQQSATPPASAGQHKHTSIQYQHGSRLP